MRFLKTQVFWSRIEIDSGQTDRDYGQNGVEYERNIANILDLKFVKEGDQFQNSSKFKFLKAIFDF